MSKQGSSAFMDALKGVFAPLVIIIAYIACLLLFNNVMGNPVNFEGGNPAGHALEGNYLAIIYKGGFIVPFLFTCITVVVVFLIERLFTLSRAKGKGRINVFVRNLQQLLAADKIEEAIEKCDKQKGSLANVMKAGLLRYRDLQKDKELSKDQKILSIQKAYEEATALELPSFQKNMVIFSTLAPGTVLIGLTGTVLGMIRAFAALAQSGAPDALALSQGISEALINTALGISGSLLALLIYNYLSTDIEEYTFKMDEAGFSLTQSFAASLKNA